MLKFLLGIVAALLCTAAFIVWTSMPGSFSGPKEISNGATGATTGEAATGTASAAPALEKVASTAKSIPATAIPATRRSSGVRPSPSDHAATVGRIRFRKRGTVFE